MSGLEYLRYLDNLGKLSSCHPNQVFPYEKHQCGNRTSLWFFTRFEVCELWVRGLKHCRCAVFSEHCMLCMQPIWAWKTLFLIDTIKINFCFIFIWKRSIRTVVGSNKERNIIHNSQTWKICFIWYATSLVCNFILMQRLNWPQNIKQKW